MKNMEMTWATKSTSPTATNTVAIPNTTREALYGSDVWPRPCASHSPILRKGKMPSEARACKVRGATNAEPSAEEIVAQARPMGMIGPHTAIRDMISSSPASASGDAETASL